MNEVKIAFDPNTNCNIITLSIPKEWYACGPIPTQAEYSNCGIALDHDLDAGWESSIVIEPESMAMMLLRAAYVCAVQENGLQKD